MRQRASFTPSLRAASYSGAMNGTADIRRMETAARDRSSVQAPSTVRISLTSFAVCVGILAWAIVNAHLGQP